MGNLFLDAMDVAEVGMITKIKANKQFLSRIIRDLGQVFTIVESNQDGGNYTRFSIKRTGNQLPILFFNANVDGITFTTKLLGYRTNNERPERALGWIIEKI